MHACSKLSCDVPKEDSQAAAGGGKVMQQLMADHEWSWEEEETALAVP